MWNDDEDSDRLGFGRPPRDTQFRKGQSGNPKGRPRKAALTVVDDLEETPQEKILRKLLDRDAGKPFLAPGRTPTALEALLLAQYQSALKGNQFAARHILDAQANMEQRDRARAKAQAERERELFAWVVRWKAKRVDAWTSAERQGREPEEIWPHPDDILIDEQHQRFRVRGPLDEAGVPFFQYLRARRDLCACEAGLCFSLTGELRLLAVKLNVAMVSLYNGMLPQRWQYGSSLEDEILSIERMGARPLEERAAEFDAEAQYWNKVAFPKGRKIKLGPKERKLYKPFLPLLEVGSFNELERKLERESGNPPSNRRA